MSAAIDIDRGLERMVDALGRLARAPLDDLLAQLGADLESGARRRLTVEKAGPGGEAWPEWSAAYAASRPPKGGLLELSGDLIDSIRWELEGLTVLVGSPQVYALTHQMGDPARSIPPRPYLGISRDDAEAMQETADRWLAAIMEGGA